MKLTLVLIACAVSLGVAVPTGDLTESGDERLPSENLTTSTTIGVDPAHHVLPRDEVLSFELGNLKMNVGRISQEDIYWKIFGAISDLTLDTKPAPWTTIKVLKPCKGRTGAADECWADMQIWIERISTDSTQIELLMQQTIASAVSRMVVNPKNCWSYRRDELINLGTFCNIGNSISIKLAGRNIDIYFKSETDRRAWGHFDCVGSLTPTHQAIDEKVAEFRDVLGLAGFGRNVRCLDDGVTREVEGG